MTSDLQFQANRLNAQHSTGPRSAEGKSVSRFNALKHGLDARSHIIPGEDAADFETLAGRYFAQFQPDGPAEEMLVRVLTESDWLGRRYARAETLLIATLLRDADPEVALPDLFTRISASKSPLPHLYRRRDAARRDWFRALRELQKLQKERRSADADAAAPELEPALAGHPAENGFVPPTPDTPGQIAPAGGLPPLKKAS